MDKKANSFLGNAFWLVTDGRNVSKFDFSCPTLYFRGGHKDELAAAATTGDIGIGVFLRPEAEAGVKWAVKTEEGAILSGVQNRGEKQKNNLRNTERITGADEPNR